MSEENNSQALKKDLLEQQIHDVVEEFESLKHLNLEYINTNERLNNEINNLKELNEQQIILNDNMIDSNKEIFKGSKRKIFWFITLFSLAAIILSFQLIDKRIDDKMTGKAEEAINKINNNLKITSDNLTTSKQLQDQIQKDIGKYKTTINDQEEQIKINQQEFKKILNNFRTTTNGVNDTIRVVSDDYAMALNNFKTLLAKKESEIKDLKSKFVEELTKLSNYTQEQITAKKVAKKVIPKKVIVKKTAPKKIIPKKVDKSKLINDLLQKAYNYQKKTQYTNAIKSYKEVLKLDSTKDIAYYNLGIIYGNQKKYTLAIQAYRKSLKLNPKRNLTFTNIFEIQLITNKNFENDILKVYKDYHSDKKISLIKYEMLDIFKDVKHHKNIDKKLHDWKKNYVNTSLGSWSFIMLKNWINREKDVTTKDNLNLVLKTFEAHKSKIKG